MGDDNQLLSARLRRYFADKPAKEIAAAVPCDVRTAANIKAGFWPIARHFHGLVRSYGRDLTDALFYPDAAVARLEEEVRALEAQLEERRKAARALAASAASVAAAPARQRTAVARRVTPARRGRAA